MKNLQRRPSMVTLLRNLGGIQDASRDMNPDPGPSLAMRRPRAPSGAGFGSKMCLVSSYLSGRKGPAERGLQVDHTARILCELGLETQFTLISSRNQDPAYALDASDNGRCFNLSPWTKNVQFASCLIGFTPHSFPGWSPLFTESSETDHLVDKIESPVS